MAKKHRELKGTTQGLMISTALFFDALQAVFQIIPILGQVIAGLIALFAFLTFWVWFKFYGISFSTPKRTAIVGGSFIIELIPVLNALPTWTLAVILVIADHKKKGLLGGDKTVENDQSKGKNMQ